MPMPDPETAVGTTTVTVPATGSVSLRRRLIVLLGGLAILALAFGVVWLQSSKYEPLAVGMNAPDFSLPDLQGKNQQLSDYRGKVILDRKSTRLNSSHIQKSRMPSSA